MIKTQAGTIKASGEKVKLSFPGSCSARMFATFDWYEEPV